MIDAISDRIADRVADRVVARFQAVSGKQGLFRPLGQ